MNNKKAKDILLDAIQEEPTGLEKEAEKKEELKATAKEIKEREQEEEEEFKDELLGMEVEETDEKKKLRNNPVINGFIFLSKAFATQWKILISITIIFLVVVLAIASITFGVQHLFPAGFHNANGDNNEYLNFFETLWWVFITISTIGFGDIYPLTTSMRIWSMFIGIIGIVFVSLFTAVVVNGFAIEMQKNLEKRKERMAEKRNIKKEKSLVIEKLENLNAQKDIEIEELKWALTKITGESKDSVEKALDKMRDKVVEERKKDS